MRIHLKQTVSGFLVVALVVIGMVFTTGCRKGSEPVEPDPEPVVLTTTGTAEAPSRPLEEVAEGLSPAEQVALSRTLADEAAGEITPENAAAMAEAMERELDQELLD